MKSKNTKNRVKKYLELIIMVAICMAMLVGAVVTVEAGLHVHIDCGQWVEATNPSCTEPGYIAHYVCKENTSKWLSKTYEKWGHAYYSEMDVTISQEALGHNYKLTDNGDGTHSGKCTRCSSSQEKQAHTLKYTSNSDGTHTVTCTDGCGYTKTEGHTLQHFSAKAASCAAAGNIEYWYCAACNTYFSDSNGKNIISKDSTVIAKTENHNYQFATYDGEYTYIENWSTVEKAFKYHIIECSVCHTKVKDTVHVACPSDISEVEKTAIKAALYSIDDDYELKTSALSYHDEVKATCKSKGKKAYYSCGKCTLVFTDNSLTATPVDESTLVLNEDPNNHVNTAYKQASNPSQGHIKYCKDCGIEITGVTAHNWKTENADSEGWVTDTPVSCTVDGKYHRTCADCGYVENKTEPKNGPHEYVWEDIGNGQHKGTCSKCQDIVTVSHKDSENFEHIVAVKPTCTENGNIEYWHCKDCGKYFSDSEGKNEITLGSTVVKATGHNLKWEVKEYSSDPYGFSCHIKKCQNEGCNYEDSSSMHFAAKEDLATSSFIGTVKWTLGISDFEVYPFDKYRQKEATCVENGLSDDYYKCTCSDCDLSVTSKGTDINSWEDFYNLFKNAKDPYFTWVDPEKLVTKAPDNHDYKIIPNPENPELGHIKKCQRAGCGHTDSSFGTDGLEQHEWESSENDGWVVIQKPTCVENGVEKRVCKTCKNGDTPYYETRSIAARGEHTFGEWHDNGDGTHSRSCTAEGCNETETVSHGTLTHHEAKDSTCTENGNYEYWYCETCKAYFTDAQGQQPTTLEAVTKEKKSHVYTTWTTKKNVWENDIIKDVEYYTHVKVCECGAVEPGSEHLTTSEWRVADSAKNWILEKLGIENANSYNEIPETDSTCHTHGTHACYQCPVCEQYFDDNGITAEIKLESEVFKELNPDNHEDTGFNIYHEQVNPADGHYQYCSKCEKTVNNAHNFGNWEVTKTPTCVETGQHKQTCSDCGYVKYEGLPIDPTNHNYTDWQCDANTGEHIGTCKDCKNSTVREKHTLKHIEAKSPTCEVEGNKEYWVCEVCGAYFNDAEGTNKIELSTTVIAPTGHDLHWVIKSQSSDPYGLSCHIKACQNPGCSYEDESTMHYAAKEELAEAGNDLTELLNKFGIESSKITPLNKHNAKAATCSETGNSRDYYECEESDCDLFLVTNDLTVSSFSDFFRKIDQLANKTPYFEKVDPLTLVTEKDSTNHNYTVYEPLNGQEDSYHINKCSWCGGVNTSYGDNGKAAHEWDTTLAGADSNGWVIDKEPKCNEEGSKHRTCKYCGRTVTESIEKTAHQYVWTCDEGTGTHSGVCSCGATKTEAHNLTPVAREESTCTVNGHEKYWECKDCGTIFKDEEGKQTTTLEALKLELKAHNYKWVVTDSDTDAFGLSCHIKRCTECQYEDESSKHYAAKEDLAESGQTLIDLLNKVGLDGVSITAFDKHGQKAANCTEEGVTQDYYKCPTDGLCFIAKDLSVSSFSDFWNIVKDAADPFFTQIKESEYIIPIIPDAHTYTKYVPAEGYESQSHIRVCCRCSHEDPDYAKTGHDWDTTLGGADSEGWVVDKAATCTQKGTKYRVCKDCSYKETGEVPIADHIFVWKYDKTTNTYTETCTGDCNGTHAVVKVNNPEHSTITVDYASEGSENSILKIVPEAGYYVSGIKETKNDGAARSLPDNSGSVTNGISYNSGTAEYTFKADTTDSYVFNITVSEELPLTGSFEIPLWGNADDIKANLAEYEALIFSKIVDTEKAPLGASDVDIKYWYSLDNHLLAFLKDENGLLNLNEDIASLDFDYESSTSNVNRHRFGSKITQAGGDLIDQTEHLKISYTSKGVGDKYTSYSIKGNALNDTVKDSEIFSVDLTKTYKVTLKGGDSTGCESYGFDEKHKDYIYVDKKEGGSEVTFSAEAGEDYLLTVKKSGLLSQAVEKGSDGKYHVTVTDDTTYEIKTVPANMEEENKSENGNSIISILEVIGDKVKTAISTSPAENYYIKNITIIDKTTGEPVDLEGEFKDGSYTAEFLNDLKTKYDIKVDYSPTLPQTETTSISINDKTPTGKDLAKYIFGSLVDEENMPDLFGEGESDADFEDVIKVEYFACSAELYEIYQKLQELCQDETVQKVLDTLGLDNILNNIESQAWKSIDYKVGSSDSAAKTGSADANTDCVVAQSEAGDLAEKALKELGVVHEFGDNEDDKEIVRVTYTAPEGEERYPDAEIITEVEAKDLRADSSVELDEETVSIVWNTTSISDAILSHASVHPADSGTDKIDGASSELSITVTDSNDKTYTTKEEIDSLDAGTYTAVVRYGGSTDYKSASSKNLNLVVEKADAAKFEVEDSNYTYDGQEHAPTVTSLSKDGKTIPYITVTVGIDASLKAEAFLNVSEDTNVEVLGYSVKTIYDIIKERVAENDEITLDGLIEELNYISPTLNQLIETYEELTKNEFWEKVEALIGTNVVSKNLEKLKTAAGYLETTIDYLEQTREDINMNPTVQLDKNPSNAGVYGVYGMAFDKNYNYADDLGYITIKPVDKYSVTWNYSLDDKNYLISDEVSSIDFGAKLEDKTAEGLDSQTPTITYVVYGIKTNNEVQLKKTTNPAELNEIFANPGVYREAVILLGNEATVASRTITVTKPYSEWSIVKIFTNLKNNLTTLITNWGTKTGNETFASKLVKMIANLRTSLSEIYNDSGEK